MIIKVGRDWRIRSDRLQWIVEKRLPGAKATRHQWKAQAFHKSLDNAVVWCGKRQVMDLPGEFGGDALPPLCAALDAIVAEVKGALDSKSIVGYLDGAISPRRHAGPRHR